MTSVSSINDVYGLYGLLVTLGIPILGADSVPRRIEDIVSDMLRAFRKCSDLNISSSIIDAVNFICEGGYELSEAQKLVLEAISDEQTRLLFAKQAADQAKESDAALDDFLSSFRIIGGDDT